MAAEEFFPIVHPEPEKRGVRIDRTKYHVLRAAILENLQKHGPMTFKKLGALVEDQLRGKFEGSVMWDYTTVKRDLEARGEIRRAPGSGPQLIEIVQ